MGVGLPRPHWPSQLLCMSITALPGTALSIRFDSPGRIGRWSIPDKAYLSRLGARSRSGAKPTLASTAVDADRFLNKAVHSWPAGQELSGGAQICEGGPACL
jgi:hypothetical protein